jgi:hypothetical protein
METAGAVVVFQRSEQELGVMYMKYLGDGDSKGFRRVVKSKAYGDTPIENLECLEHE